MFQKLIILIFYLGTISCLNLCGDWTQYKDSKCFKVIPKKVNQEEALSGCAKYDSDSTVLSIHSKEEQEFLNDMLGNYNSISMYAWIGMKYTNGTYKWLDSSDNTFNNWEDDAVTDDGTNPCVQMLLVKPNLGQWIDVPCTRTALIVCQKKQVFNLNTMRIAFESMENEMKSYKELTQSMENEIKSLKELTQSSSIPEGFLYIQLPNQTSPDKLWPQLNWTDVTFNYAGLFFRAEGGDSSEFGQIQQAYKLDFNSIDTTTTLNYYTTTSYEKEFKSLGTWDCYSSYARGTCSISETKGNSRPVNTAIRVWKRI